MNEKDIPVFRFLECYPEGWVVKEEVPGETVVFGAPYADKAAAIQSAQKRAAKLTQRFSVVRFRNVEEPGDFIDLPRKAE